MKEENIDIFWENIEKQCRNGYLIYFDEIQKQVEEFGKEFLLFPYEQQLEEAAKMEQLGRSKGKSIKYLILTFLMKITEDNKYLKAIYELAMEDKELTKENKYFLHYQLVGASFQRTCSMNNEIKIMINQFYKQIYSEYVLDFQDKLIEIPKSKRNNDVVIVFISQFLSMAHGPTKTALDRCYVLAKKLQKKVWLINTADFMPSVGLLPIFGGSIANYQEKWCHETQIQYKGEVFRFFQCANCMPNDVEIGNMLDFVRKVSPSKIFHIGGGSMVFDLCDKLVPGMVVNTVHSGLSYTESTYQIIGRTLTQLEKQNIKRMGKSLSHVIECRFTFALRQQEHKYTRKELGIPEGKFTVLIVGARLDGDIQEEFAQLLSRLMEKGLFVVFMGVFKSYEDWCARQQIWKENSKYIGFVSDVLAVNECCDLYLNPIRVGGGTSIVEAFYKGLPAITCPVGDVSLGAGEDFTVENYEEMEKLAQKYASDKKFYGEQSQKAKKRAEYLMDSEGIFPEAIQEMERREKLRESL